MKVLLGRKVGMSELISEDGTTTPVTLVEAGPCVVAAKRTHEQDGYEAVVIGYGKDARPNKAQAGQFQHLDMPPKYLREVRGASDLDIGDSLDVTTFTSGDTVVVSGRSKGKGFSGTIKRHNFSRGPMTHGSRNVRRPGSIGGMYPQKVYKGRKMPGRMGGDTTTVRGLEVRAVDPERNVLAISGAVPGPKHGLLLVQGVEQ